MCLAVGPLTDVDDIVVTGSKDHYIKVCQKYNIVHHHQIIFYFISLKVFEVPSGATGSNSGSLPRLHLEPPHYDGVQCLALSDDILFSGSRDTSIKKWHLNSQDSPHVCLQVF